MATATNKMDEKIVVADSRGRVNLGLSAVKKTFRVRHEADGEYSLVPMIAIPERELWFWQNAEARQSVERGLEQARLGMGVVVDFSEFLEDDEDGSA